MRAPWLRVLPLASECAWVRLLCHVREVSPRRGRIRVRSADDLAYVLHLVDHAAEVEAMVTAGIDGGALAWEGPELVVLGWDAHQSPDAQRKRRQREAAETPDLFISPDLSGNSGQEMDLGSMSGTPCRARQVNKRTREQELVTITDVVVPHATAAPECFEIDHPDPVVQRLAKLLRVRSKVTFGVDSIAAAVESGLQMAKWAQPDAGLSAWRRLLLIDLDKIEAHCASRNYGTDLKRVISWWERSAANTWPGLEAQAVPLAANQVPVEGVDFWVQLESETDGAGMVSVRKRRCAIRDGVMVPEPFDESRWYADHPGVDQTDRLVLAARAGDRDAMEKLLNHLAPVILGPASEERFECVGPKRDRVQEGKLAAIAAIQRNYRSGGMGGLSALVKMAVKRRMLQLVRKLPAEERAGLLNIDDLAEIAG